jgi:murein L,D-transpeptidase YcbB/YkuD
MLRATTFRCGSARATTAIARLKDAAADGLEASAYPVPRFGASTGPAALASGDIKLTSSVLTFARHLAVGRIAPSRVFEQVDYGDHTPRPADVLKTIADAGDVNAALDSFNPPDPGFHALKRKLAALRASAGGSHAPIPSGRAIKPGAKDERVPMLRARLGLRAKRNDTTYDRALVKAIQALQQRHDLKPSGIIGRKTLAAINEPKASQVIDRVLANMERWRWLPRDLGSSYVMVNIPDYTLKVVHRHRVVWRTKIIAGKPETPTPLATATMDSVIVNPSWHVPQSIIENELLPRYQTDPNIFERMGLEVKRGRDGNISVVQPPGAANALGRIKFNFPNKFQVYLHDTPQKSLFKYSRRAFSHGCMRVQDPTKFGEIVLQLAMNRPSPNSRQLQSMFGSDEHVFKLADRPMVHLTYQTAFVDDAGKLQLRDDVYGFDGRIDDILHGRQPRIAAAAPPPTPKRDIRTIRNIRTEAANEELLRRVERQEAYNPPFNPLRIFENIFR